MISIDSALAGRYSYCAAAKSAGGCRNPDINHAPRREPAVFLCAAHCYKKIMVGRVGQPQGWPGSWLTGIATPARLTTYECRNSGGEFSKLNPEVADMATTPTRIPFDTVDRLYKTLNFIDSTPPGRYIYRAAAKSAAGCSNSNVNHAYSREPAVFLCAAHCYNKIMVGRAGQPQGWPVSWLTGIATPVRLTTHERSNSGGEFSELNPEVAAMATVPSRTLHDASDRLYEISRALRHLNKFDFTDSVQHELLEQLRTILTAEKSALSAVMVQQLHADIMRAGGAV